MPLVCLTQSSRRATIATGVIGAVATKLAMVGQPAGAVDSVAFTTQPSVRLQDASNLNVSQAAVTITVTKSSGSGTLGGTTSALTDNSGIATFTNLVIVGTGAHVLAFASTGLTGINSSSFTVAASVGGAIFTDSFATGDWSHTAGGISWDGQGSRCTIVTTFGHSDTKSLRVAYDGPGQHGQQGFAIAPATNELWIEWYVYWPDGTENPSVGPKWERNHSSGGNNKFFRIFALPEHNYPRMGASTYGNSSGDERYFPEAGIYAGTGTVSQLSGGGEEPIVTSSTRGTWHQIRVHVRGSTVDGPDGQPPQSPGNGVHQTWFDGVLVCDVPSLSDWEANGRGFENGYFQGAHNGNYIAEPSYVYLDDFAFYSTNPGW